MRADALNQHIEPVRTEMTDTQQIPISHVCNLDQSKSKQIPAVKNLSQVCSTEKDEPESIIVDESFTEEREPENAHKSINRNEEKYAIDETEHDETSLIDSPVINELSYFNLFECGKNILNRLDATN